MKKTVSFLLSLALLFAILISSVSAYVPPFEIPDAAEPGKVNEAATVEYKLREGGTYLYCNNPERLTDFNLGKALMIEHDISGKVFFTNENFCAVNKGFYLGLQVRNHSGKPVKVTVHNIGYQIGEDWVGQQEWTDFFQTTFELESGGGEYAFSKKKTPHPFTETTYTIPDGKYIYVMGGTTADAYGNTNVAGSADRKATDGQVVNGVVYFTVDGVETGVDAAFVCYSSSSSPVTTDKQQGYVVEKNGTTYARQYLGSAPFLCVDASIAWNIDDRFKDGNQLPVSYNTTYYDDHTSFGVYGAYANPKTAYNRSTKWMTNLNPQSDHTAVGTDMMPFYCVTEADGKSVVVDVHHNDGVSKSANIGNWMTVYEESLTFQNSGTEARTFTVNMTIKGVVGVNVRDADGELIGSVYHHAPGPVYTHTVLPGETETIVLEYVLLANSYGNITHSVTVGTDKNAVKRGARLLTAKSTQGTI